jgi:hypothetical protein
MAAGKRRRDRAAYITVCEQFEDDRQRRIRPFDDGEMGSSMFRESTTTRIAGGLDFRP